VSKNIITTILPTEKRLRIDLAVVRQGLSNADFFLVWVHSLAILSDPLTSEAESDQPQFRPNDHMKKPLLDALGSNCTNLRTVTKVTKIQADVSKY
jgi:maleate cis-trans isomerase